MRVVAGEHPRQGAAAELPTPQVESRVEGLRRAASPRPRETPTIDFVCGFAVAWARLDVDGDALAWFGGAEGVGLVHAHQRGDVEALLELLAEDRTPALAPCQDVGMALAPGDVLDVGHDCIYPLAVASEAEVEGDRVEGVAEVAQPREEADRAGGALAGGGCDGVPRALVQRLRR